MKCELKWPDFVETEVRSHGAPQEVVIAFLELAEQKVSSRGCSDGAMCFEGAVGSYVFAGSIRYVWQDGTPWVGQWSLDWFDSAA